MRFPALALIALAACSAPGPTAPARIIDGASLGVYDATRPAPTGVSAVLVGTDAVQGLDTVAVTFTDAAEGEYLTSAYFLPSATRAAATQNITGTAEASGERTVAVVIESGHTQVELRNLWTANSSDPTQNIWGPFSEIVTIASPVTATTTSCRAHGKCK